MTPLHPDVRALLEGPNFVHLATLMADGAPHSVAIWAGVEDSPDGERIVFFTSPGSRKARNLDVDGRVAISVVDHDNPYRAGSLRGRVVERRVDDLATMDRLSQVYTGRDFPMRTNVVYVIEPERSAFVDLPFEHTPGTA
jgi:PPOX class probable F420-dependent enzyme